MRSFQLFFILICLSFSVSAQRVQKGFVAFKTGLNMREKPDVGAKVLVRIPYGTAINYQSNAEGGAAIVTEGMDGYWVKTTFNGKTGWVVNSYLLPWAPPKAGVKNLKEYLKQISQPFGPPLVLKKGKPEGGLEGEYFELRKQLYKNGAEIHEGYAHEYGGEQVFLPDLNLAQAYNLLRLLEEFKIAMEGLPEFPQKSGKYTKGNVEYKLDVYREPIESGMGWIYLIRLEFSPDANFLLQLSMGEGQAVISWSGGV